MTPLVLQPREIEFMARDIENSPYSEIPIKYMLIQARIVNGPLWEQRTFGPGRWVNYEHENFTHVKAAESLIGSISTSTYSLGEPYFHVQTRMVKKGDEQLSDEARPLMDHMVSRHLEITVKALRKDDDSEDNAG